jgi:hypothetical protein
MERHTRHSENICTVPWGFVFAHVSRLRTLDCLQSGCISITGGGGAFETNATKGLVFFGHQLVLRVVGDNAEYSLESTVSSSCSLTGGCLHLRQMPQRARFSLGIN